jgi:hypothetical protein
MVAEDYFVFSWVGFEVLTMVVVNVAILCDIAPHSLYVNQCFSGTYHLLQGLKSDWKWRWYIPLKCQFTYRVHGAISQKMATLKPLLITWFQKISVTPFCQPHCWFLLDCVSLSNLLILPSCPTHCWLPNLYKKYITRSWSYTVNSSCKRTRTTVVKC